MQLIRKKKISQLPLLESTTENTYVHVVDSDENYRIEADKITASLASKTYVDQQDALKVDKVDGKSLIADTEISRLEGVDNQTLSGLGGEPSANKQDSLAVDGNGVKFPTVDAVNSGLATKPAKTTQVVAGAGLTGGGTLESDRTLNVVSANDGITVNADNIQLNAVDNLASTSATRPLSANQGRALDAAKVDKVAGSSLVPDTEIDKLAEYPAFEYLESSYENLTNKTSDIESNKTSVDKYPTTKGVYDWAVGKFLSLTQTTAQIIGATGARLAKLWATDIESTNMPTVGGVSLSTTFAAKSTITDYIALYSRKIATVVNGVITAIQDTWDAYNSRVVADSATVKNLDFVKRYYQMCYDNNMFDSIKFAWLGEGGSKFRTSGINTFFTKIYSMLGRNDADQTTSTNQPYLSGNIAPNEKYALKNPNGGANYMTHPTISFSSTDSWSVTTVLNWDGTSDLGSFLFGNISSYPEFRLRSNSSDLFQYVSSDIVVSVGGSSSKILGKTSVLTIVADGIGGLKIYLNGVVYNTFTALSNRTSALFNSFLKVQGNQYYQGKLYVHIIRSQALTQSQITAEYNLLRSYYPEIPNVTIGTQTWATSNCEMAATPQGNVIAEVQANTNVNGISNGTFDTNITGAFSKGNHLATWDSSQALKLTASGPYAAGSNDIYISAGSLIVGQYLKLEFRAKSLSGNTSLNARVDFGSNQIFTLTSEYQNFTVAIQKATNTSTSTTGFRCGLDGIGECLIDDIVVTKYGWSGSQELYDGIYAQTVGTVEQKTYAAVKAAAMWCHYNNDSALGAVYGKLYNWFAVKLMQMDIDYYNIANPTTPWGWRVPTSTDFTTLSTYLGGDAVAGGKLKKEGITYWTSPNTGADNSSGFSALGGGQRDDYGLFANGFNQQFFRGSDGYRMYMLFSSAAVTIATIDNKRAYSVRLIKN